MSAVSVREFETRDFAAGADVIAGAFYADPLFHYWCQRREPAYRKQQYAMAEVLNDLQSPTQGHSLGVFEDATLLGLAYLKDVQSMSSYKGMLPLLLRVMGRCGLGATVRFVRVGMELPRHWPRGHQLYLSTLAVSPAQQGKGHGRRLLQAADDCARAHGYPAICLDTQNPDNVDYYRSQGYQLNAHIHIGALETWNLVKTLQ